MKDFFRALLSWQYDLQWFQEKHYFFSSSEIREACMSAWHSTSCPKSPENTPGTFVWLPLLCCLLSALTTGTYLLKSNREKCFRDWLCGRMARMTKTNVNLNNAHHLIPSSPTVPQAWAQIVLTGSNCWIQSTTDIIAFETSSKEINTHTHTSIFFSSYTFWVLNLFFSNAIHFCSFPLHSF